LEPGSRGPLQKGREGYLKGGRTAILGAQMPVGRGPRCPGPACTAYQEPFLWGCPGGRLSGDPLANGLVEQHTGGD